MKKKLFKVLGITALTFGCIINVDAARIVVGSDTATAGANNRSVSVELKDSDVANYTKVEFSLSISGTSYASLGSFNFSTTGGSLSFNQANGLYTVTSETALFETTLGTLSYKTDTNLNADFKIVPTNVKFYKSDGTVVTGGVSEGTIKYSAPKSTDATLSALSVSQGELSPTFASNVTSYTVTVADTISTIRVNATTTDAKATKTGTGTKNLTMGANTIDVVVTAEDGTTSKTYTITVNRGEEENEVGAYLSSLKINNIGCKLSPEFDKKNNKYTVDITTDITKLDIEYKTEDANAKVEIDGNEDFVDGENLVTIKVTGSDNSTQVYEITVNKGEEEDSVIATNKEEKQTNNKKWIIITLVTIVILLILGISLVLFKRKKKNKTNEDGTPKVKKKSKLKELLEDPDDDEDDEEQEESSRENINKFVSTTNKEDEIEKTKEFNFRDFN